MKKWYFMNIFILKIKIFIYVGSDKSLLDIDWFYDDNFYYGRDGLGDILDLELVDEFFIKVEMVLNVIVCFCWEYKGFLRIV